MSMPRAVRSYVLLGALLLLGVARVCSATETTVPISAELATSIAADLFPVTLRVSNANLFLTTPILLFHGKQRIAMQVRMQAYDHRPGEGVAISEMGQARISGILDYDSDSRQILLHDPRIDELEFDRSSDVTVAMKHAIRAAWNTQVTDPIRSEIPTHPYTILIKDNIRTLSYDGQVINLKVFYE